MLPIPFCKCRRKRYAIKQTGGPKMIRGGTMTHTEHNPAEEHRRDDCQAQVFVESRAQHEIYQPDQVEPEPRLFVDARPPGKQ